MATLSSCRWQGRLFWRDSTNQEHSPQPLQEWKCTAFVSNWCGDCRHDHWQHVFRCWWWIWFGWRSRGSGGCCLQRWSPPSRPDAFRNQEAGSEYLRSGPRFFSREECLCSCCCIWGSDQERLFVWYGHRVHFVWFDFSSHLSPCSIDEGAHWNGLLF